MSKRVQLIINPIAGNGNKEGLGEYAAGRLAEHGWEPTVSMTQCRGDATRLAREAVEQGFDAVIAAGGDGTVNETARALCDTGVTLGIIPCGSGNGLARHLNIPVDPGESLNVMLEDHPALIDYCSLNGLSFFCTCGVGFDASVSEKFASKEGRGLANYVKSAIEVYHNYKPAQYTLRVGDQVIAEQAFLIAVCNASQYGNNAYIAPDASIDDGLLDITVVHAANPLRTAIMGLDMMTGYINHNTLIRHLRVPSVIIERAEEGPVHIDGEPMRMDGPLDIRCYNHGLKVFTPSKTHPFVPIITPVGSFMQDFRLSIKHLLKIR